MTRLAVSYCSLFLLSISALQAQAPLKSPENPMSSMGQLAHDRLKVRPRIAAREIEQPGEACTEESHQPCAPQGPFAALASTQAEVSIAVDSSGQHIVSRSLDSCIPMTED
jgi:hypothetical protein